MNDDQAERLIEVLSRMHVDLETSMRYFRENIDKWIVWLAGQRGG